MLSLPPSSDERVNAPSELSDKPESMRNSPFPELRMVRFLLIGVPIEISPKLMDAVEN